jgi:hypothetical protein
MKAIILRDAMLRTASQDEDGVCVECSGNANPNTFTKSSTCAGVR